MNADMKLRSAKSAFNSDFLAQLAIGMAAEHEDCRNKENEASKEQGSVILFLSVKFSMQYNGKIIPLHFKTTLHPNILLPRRKQ